MGAVVKQVVHGSLAHRSARIMPGDCLAAINSLNVQNMAFHQIMSALHEAAARRPLVLTFSED